MGKLTQAMGDLFNTELSHMGEIYRGSVATRFDYFDYLNAKVNAESRQIEVGISAGKIFYIAGSSGSGKSSFALRTGYNIIADDDDGLMVVFDAEKSNSHERICAVSGLHPEEYNAHWRNKKIRLINVGTSIDNLTDLVFNIHRTKMIHGTDSTFTKKDGLVRGKDTQKTMQEAKDLPPTVIIVDSWAMIAPKKIDQDGEARGAMDAAQIAKANNAFIKANADRLFEANITLIIINHITTDIQIGPMQSDERPIKWLKPKEKLPGGNTAIYLADTLIRMEQKEAIKADKELGFHGFMVEMTLCKSRNNASGIKFMAVFNPYIGVDNTLTNYLMLKDNDYITGGGRGFALKALPDVKFSQKDVGTLYNSNPAFRKVFNNQVRDYMQNFVKDPDMLAITNGSEEEESSAVPTRDVVSKMKKGELKALVSEYQIDINPEDYVLSELRQVINDALDSLREGGEEGGVEFTEENINACETLEELNVYVEAAGYEAFTEEEYPDIEDAKTALIEALQQ